MCLKRKKRPCVSRSLSPQSGKKGGERAFLHEKLAVRSSASASFFLKGLHSSIERTILCPLFSLHPRNQRVENKVLSSVSLRVCFCAFRENRYRDLRPPATRLHRSPAALPAAGHPPARITQLAPWQRQSFDDILENIRPGPRQTKQRAEANQAEAN